MSIPDNHPVETNGTPASASDDERCAYESRIAELTKEVEKLQRQLKRMGMERDD